MATGIDLSGEWYIGNVNTTKLILGKNRLLVIDNINSKVLLNGKQLIDKLNTSFNYFFGTGELGNAEISNFTDSNDKHYNNLTINGTVAMNGFRLFVSDTLTINGILHSNGGNANFGIGGSGTGDINQDTFSVGYSGKGDDGSIESNEPSISNLSCSIGGNGGYGGGSNQIYNTCSINGNQGGNNVFSDITQARKGRGLNGEKINGGCGGRAGIGNNISIGGGGGGGGGVMIICAKNITGNGMISSNGGIGGSSLGYGGGGGGGGVIVLITESLTCENIQVNGGNNGSGILGNGVNGGDGKKIIFQMM